MKETRKKFSQKPWKKTSTHDPYTSHIDMYFKFYNIFPFVSQDSFLLDPGKGWMYQNCYASFVQMIQFLYVFHTQAHTDAHSFLCSSHHYPNGGLRRVPHFKQINLSDGFSYKNKSTETFQNAFQVSSRVQF